MAIERGSAAIAMLAVLAFGTASTAWADTPTMNGSYTATATTPSGRSLDTSWTVNSCGDGCVYVKAGAGGSQARLVDGQWVMDTMSNINCPDGTYIQYGTTAHVAWDPNTLAGTITHTYIMAACGRPAGFTETDQLHIKQASS